MSSSLIVEDGPKPISVAWGAGMNAQTAMERAFQQKPRELSCALQHYGAKLGYLVSMINETHDSYMATVSVTLETVYPRKLAAVRREVAPSAVGSAWGPAVGKVWDFIRSHPGLRTDGHNIFLYHSKEPGAPILCDFGVEVTRTFETTGEVYATETPGGEAAVAVHRGPYNRLNEAYMAIKKWMAENRRESAGHSWEIYGDPTPDPADTETTIVQLLK